MLEVKITDDFDPAKIAVSGQCFRAAAFGDGWRFVAADRVLEVYPAAPQLWRLSCTEAEWNAYWSPYFDMQRSYAAVRAAIPPEDGYLCRAAANGCGVRVLRQDKFEMLITFIISQRKSIPAIKKCVEALCSLCHHEIQTKQGSVYAFPTAAELHSVSEEELAKCSMGYRTPYVRDAAAMVASGQINLDALDALPDAALLEALMQIRGVGKKVANCVALFAYGRVNCAPVDVWIERIINEQYGGVNPFPWYGNAGILQQYMFYDAQMHKGSTAQTAQSVSPKKTCGCSDLTLLI